MNYYKFYAIIRDKFDLFLERRLIVSLQQFERKSLQEINQSIDVPKGIPFSLRKLAEATSISAAEQQNK